MITFTGSGFPPDVTVELNCLECNEPELFATIAGRIGSISPDTAEVWFDMTDGFISGTYEAVFKDPRGGSAVTEITISQAPLELSVAVLKQSTQGDDNTGLFVIRLNRPAEQTLAIPYALFGSAQQYVHYTTDLLGPTITLPAGSDSLVVTILPLDAEQSINRNISIQLNYADQPPSGASLFASMQLRSSSTEGLFRVLNFSPDSGGNVGFVTMTVTGIGFTDASSIQLSGGVTAFNTVVNETGTRLKAQLNLMGQETGSRDLIISNGSGQEITISSGFTIQQGIYPDVFVQILAPERVPRIRQRTYTIILHNQGNVDVRGYAAIAGLPADTDWTIDESKFGITSGSGFSWKDVAPVEQENDRIRISLPYVNLGANETRKIEITTSVPTAQVMELVAAWFYN